jgi:small-conductance mechanosensitive channel
MDQVVAWLDRYGISPVTFSATILLLLATGIVIVVLNRVLRRLVRGAGARIHLPYETVLMVTRFVSGSLWLVAGLLILNLWGVGISGVWTLLASGIAVIGVGFLAVWTIISNVTANLFITIWRPFHLGQSVEILPENLKGRVIDRNMMFTMLRDDDGSILQIPNNMFFQKMFRITDGGKRSFFEYLEGERPGQGAETARPSGVEQEHAGD